MDIALVVLNYLLPVIFGVLALLGVFLVKKLLDKLGVERSAKLDAMIDTYVRKGINYAEAMANTYMTQHNEKMGGASKRAKAVKVVMDELKQSGVAGVAEDLVVARIESMLVEDGANPGIPSDPQTGESAST